MVTAVRYTIEEWILKKGVIRKGTFVFYVSMKGNEDLP